MDTGRFRSYRHHPRVLLALESTDHLIPPRPHGFPCLIRTDDPGDAALACGSR